MERNFQNKYFLQKVLYKKKSRNVNLVISPLNYVIFGALQNYTKQMDLQLDFESLKAMFYF